jgi:hydroxymethylbilane synthase
MRPPRLTIASRGSKLALIQAESVAATIRSVVPECAVSIEPISTRGDTDRRAFAAIGGKGLFVAEVERAVAEGRADIAVHSAKDLTAALAEGCSIAWFPPRAPVHDVVIGGGGGDGAERLAHLPDGATVGTSSMRRRALLAEARPDLTPVEFRGNLDTRLRKLAAGDVGAAIVAAAGLHRLEATIDTGALDISMWIPAPGQGALAVEAQSERADIAELGRLLDDAACRAEVECERAFGARLEGGCSIPLGCIARADGPTLTVTGYLGHPDGGASIRDRISGPAKAAGRLGTELAEAILAGGGADLLEEVRTLEATPAQAP